MIPATSDYGIANGQQETWPFMTKGNGVPNVEFPPLQNNISPGTRTLIYRAPTYVYKVADGDTIGGVARKLFGVNTRHHRDFLRRQGFAPGALITYDGDNSPETRFDTMGDNIGHGE